MFPCVVYKSDTCSGVSLSALEILQRVCLYPSKSKIVTGEGKIPAVRSWKASLVVQEALTAFALVQ